MKRRHHLTYSFNKKHKSNKKQSKNDDDDSEDEKTDVKMVDNHIWFNADVTNESIQRLIYEIHIKNIALQKIKNKFTNFDITPKPIFLHINSYGGDLFESMAGIDAILNSEIPIHTIIEGTAASAATLLSIVGKKRYITKHSYMLIHQLSSSMWGTMAELEDDHTNNQALMDRLYKLYMEYSNLTKSKLKKLLKKDIWWDAEKCIEVGLVDGIYKDGQEFDI
tara:strand:+ start:3778 stop:4443 length:666 start_codon:yes stop_codon:yes gene_type:complete